MLGRRARCGALISALSRAPLPPTRAAPRLRHEGRQPPPLPKGLGSDHGGFYVRCAAKVWHHMRAAFDGGGGAAAATAAGASSSAGRGVVAAPFITFDAVMKVAQLRGARAPCSALLVDEATRRRRVARVSARLL